jgi:hypothetical protein
MVLLRGVDGVAGRCRGRARGLARRIMSDDVQGSASTLRTGSVQCRLLLFVQQRGGVRSGGAEILSQESRSFSL